LAAQAEAKLELLRIEAGRAAEEAQVKALEEEHRLAQLMPLPRKHS